MDRREFIEKTAKAGAAVCCLGAFSMLESCTSVYYAQHKSMDKQITLAKSEYGDRKFVVIDNEGLNGPIYLTNNNEEKEFKALSMICTHKQCTVDPAGNVLVCPCHGAEFSNQGKVLGGPTNKDLSQYKVTIDKELITIHLE